MLNEQNEGCGVDLSGSGHERIESYCEYFHSRSSSAKCAPYVAWLKALLTAPVSSVNYVMTSKLRRSIQRKSEMQTGIMAVIFIPNIKHDLCVTIYMRAL